MSSTPSRTSTVKVVNNRTGVTTTSKSVTAGRSTTTSKTTTIGKAPASTVSSKKTTTAKKKTTTAAKAAGIVWGETWITGPNDSRPLCGPVAVANDLLGRFGLEATNSEIERLYRAAGGIGDTGAPMEFVFAAACDGFAGCRLNTWDESGVAEADILLLVSPYFRGAHAAAYRDGNVIAWGAAVPLAELNVTPIAAWALAWHGEEDH